MGCSNTGDTCEEQILPTSVMCVVGRLLPYESSKVDVIVEVGLLSCREISDKAVPETNTPPS